MPVRRSESIWDGDIQRGRGEMTIGSAVWTGPYSFGSRMQDQPGTNPEELIGAAHSGCFSMALAAGLGRAGFTPRRIRTTAEVRFEKVGEGFKITGITLRTRGDVPEIDEATFQKHAEDAKRNCPVSQALAAIPIELESTLGG
jgi:lipoyl-dependent peroxiredoxin